VKLVQPLSGKGFFKAQFKAGGTDTTAEILATLGTNGPTVTVATIRVHTNKVSHCASAVVEGSCGCRLPPGKAKSCIMNQARKSCFGPKKGKKSKQFANKVFRAFKRSCRQ